MKPGALTRKLQRLSGASTPALSAPPSATETLAALRERMALLLLRDSGQARAAKPALVSEQEPPSPSNFSTLPVSLVQTEVGPLWRKLWRVPREYRVGVAPCHHARSVDWSQLACLALSPDLATVNADQLLFLDTETTGLGGAGALAFLVGLAFVQDGEFWVEQVLLEGPQDEAALLAHLQTRMATRPVMVSFNGKTFDWPLLVSRYAMNRLQAPTTPRHLDLLHVARRLHKARLGSCSLRALEVQILGFERLGDIDGMEVAARYSHYLRSGDASGLEAVLEHNFWDVLSMLALVGLYGATELSLAPVDLAAAARTMARAKAFPAALSRADQAVLGVVANGAEGNGVVGTSDVDLARVHLVRGEIRKALGDREGAIEDFTNAQADPKARLHLAKLYEHVVKDPEAALQWALRGTGERPEAVHKRLARLGVKKNTASPKSRPKA